MRLFSVTFFPYLRYRNGNFVPRPYLFLRAKSILYFVFRTAFSRRKTSLMGTYEGPDERSYRNSLIGFVSFQKNSLWGYRTAAKIKYCGGGTL